MSTVNINPLEPGVGRKRFFLGREQELLDFLAQPGATQQKAAEHFGCYLNTVEKELKRMRDAAKAQKEGQPPKRG